MYFIVQCTDKSNAAQIRADNRDAHLAYLKAHQANIKVAGPFLNAEGGMIGSLLIIKGEREDDVRALLREDPYAQANLFSHVTIQPWRWVVGAPQV